MKILVTGFHPFGDDSVNPSELVAKNFGGFSLPVVRGKCFESFKVVFQKINPSAILMLGQASGSQEIRLERIAINLDDFRIPDNEGNQPKEETILPNGPAGYFSTLPLSKIYRILNKKQIPVQYSLSAGTYVCNHLFYRVMNFLTNENRVIPAGFIHIPPDWEITELIKAIKEVVQVIRRDIKSD